MTFNTFPRSVVDSSEEVVADEGKFCNSGRVNGAQYKT